MQVQSPTTSATGSTSTTAVRLKAAKRSAPAVVSVTQPYGLSFHTQHTDARGNVVQSNAFDVPPEAYGRGWDTGRRAAAELLAVIKAAPQDGHPMFGRRLCDLLPDVATALAEGAPDLSPDRRGAALGFLSVLDAAIQFAARTADMQGFVQRELERSDGQRLRAAERDAAKRASFVARMQAARKAKRTAQAVAATHKGTIAMDMVPPYAVYADGVVIATHDTEREAHRHFDRLRAGPLDAKAAPA